MWVEVAIGAQKAQRYFSLTWVTLSKAASNSPCPGTAGALRLHWEIREVLRLLSQPRLNQRTSGWLAEATLL